MDGTRWIRRNPIIWKTTLKPLVRNSFTSLKKICELIIASLGLPREDAKVMLLHKVKVTSTEKGFHHIEKYDEVESCYEFALDEETDGFEYLPGKFKNLLVTQFEANAFKWFIRDKKGQFEEDFELIFVENGLIMDGVEKKSGVHMQLFFAKIPNMFGTMQAVSNVNGREFMSALGLKEDDFVEWEKEEKKVHFRDLGRKRIEARNFSQVIPWKAELQFDEEHDLQLLGRNYKV